MKTDREKEREREREREREMDAVRQRIKDVFPAYTTFSDEGIQFNDENTHPYMPRNIVFEEYTHQKRKYVEILALFGVFVVVSGILTAAVFATTYKANFKYEKHIGIYISINDTLSGAHVHNALEKSRKHMTTMREEDGYMGSIHRACRREESIAMHK